MSHVALISEHASPLATIGGVDSGGQNIYVAQVAQHLNALGHQVDVFTRRDHYQTPFLTNWNGVNVISIPAGPAKSIRKEELLPHMRRFTHYMIQWMKDGHTPYDICHANFFMSGMAASGIKSTYQIPFVITFHALGLVRRLHQGTADGFPEQRINIETDLMSEADQIISECPQDEDDLVQLYKADSKKMTTIPCGFDPQELQKIDKSVARKVLGWPARRPIVVHIGRMVPRKGIETIIQSFSRLKSRSKLKPLLVIVGGDPNGEDSIREVKRLRNIVKEEKLMNVRFNGPCSRQMLKFYYSAADVFVTTPWYEPFGITPVEAMSCGVPVIGSDVGGLKSTIVPNETGYLVPPKDPDALAKCLQYILEHPQQREILGQEAIKRAYRHFTWRRIAQDISNLYEKIIAKTKKHGRLTRGFSR